MHTPHSDEWHRKRMRILLLAAVNAYGIIVLILMLWGVLTGHYLAFGFLFFLLIVADVDRIAWRFYARERKKAREIPL